jgi:hypothetical protein
MAGEGINVMPFMDVNGGGKSHDGMGGGWVWILLIFILLLGGGGLGGFGGRGAAADIINNDFLYTQQKIDGNTAAMNAGFANVANGICDLRHQMDMGFCNTNRSIDQVRFEAAQNTCAITTAITASTQAIKDVLAANEIQGLRDRILEQSGAISNGQQTAAIINALRPYPTPSYFAPNPNAVVQFAAPFSAFGGGCDCNSGCNPCGRHGVL